MSQPLIEIYKTERTLFVTPIWRLLINGSDYGTYKTRKAAWAKALAYAQASKTNQ